jgi:hypothetical protein
MSGGMILHRLQTRLFGWHPPPLNPDARAALGQGRALWQAGDRVAARAAFARAALADPRALCHDWGILPGLEAAGRGDVKVRLDARLAAWYGPARATAPEEAALAVKARLRPWADRHGFATARLVAAAPHLDALDWPALRGAALSPQGLVFKPANQSTCKGVAVLAGGINHMAEAPGGRDVGPDPAAYLRGLWAREGLADSAVLVEERLCDSGAARDPSLVIPRDIKVYAVAGMAGYVAVLDRNAPGGRRNKQSYDAKGRPVPPTLTTWPEGRPRPAPPGLGPVVAEAMRASRLLPQVLRLDFYHTPAGPVLGEVTTYPTAGLDYTPFSRRTILQMWEIHPD